MEFKNEIDRNRLIVALKKWALKIDGDASIGGILCAIPYTIEMEKIINWHSDTAKGSIIKAIGCCSREFSIESVLDVYSNEKLDLDKWANNKADEIMKAYDELVSKLNRKISYCLAIKKTNGDVVDKLYGTTIAEIVSKLCNYRLPRNENGVAEFIVGWKSFNEFTDAIYCAFYSKGSVSLVEPYQCNFIICDNG